MCALLHWEPSIGWIRFVWSPGEMQRLAGDIAWRGYFYGDGFALEVANDNHPGT